MINFEEMRFISQIIHYLILGVPLTWVLIKNYKNIINLILKINLLLMSWAAIVYFNRGCPLTFLENYLSERYYGVKFYPDYSFNDSDVEMFLSIVDYRLLIGGLILSVMLNYLKNNDDRRIIN